MESAVEHYERQSLIAALGLAGARRAGTPERVLSVVTAAQMAAVEESERAVEAMLTEQGIDARSEFTVSPSSLAGVASDGRDLASLLALADTAARFDLIVETQLADVGRHATAAAMGARPQVTGYVRMVEPGACSRCIILAGRWYRWSDGFARHPRCRCTHIPSNEDAPGDLRTDPNAMFEAMSQADQDRAFGVAGAEAIRQGADMNQVVNARRGMAPAQLAGRDVLTTSEGVTRRGEAYAAMKGRGVVDAGADVRGAGDRYRRVARARLMPETILEIASDREAAARLLSLYGYIR